MTKVWENLGHQVTVLAGMVNGATGIKHSKYKGVVFNKDQYSEGIQVLRCYTSGAYNVNFIGRLWAYFSFVFSSIWAGFFKTTGQYDIIIVSSPPLFVGITAYVLSLFKRIPFVFEVRDLWPESAIDTGVVTNKWIIKFAYWFETFVYEKSSAINVLTPAFRDVLISDKNVPSDKIHLIPNAADFSLSDQLLETFDEALFRKSKKIENKFVVTYVGAHGVANHLDQLINAAALIKDEQVLIQLIGNGMEKKRLVQEVDSRRIDNVIFIDSVPKSKVFEYILSSDMGASVLKKADTFKTIYSNKTFDYMACKKPVLLAIDGVSRELIELADCGIYAEPENSQAIADAILFTKNNRELFNQKGENGYLYAKKHFDRRQLAEKYLDLLSDLC
jgi:glycosyltransferase involved in cell wall biosynthesis